MARTTLELQEASNFLIYEIWMFRGLTHAIDNKIYNARGVISNAILESWLVHIRELADFFYKSKGYPDDIFAVDFFPSNQWNSIRSQNKSSLLTNYCKDINKHVAHITTSRSGKDWANDKLAICQELDDLIDKFLKNVDPSYLGKRWDGFNYNSSNLNQFLQPFITSDIQPFNTSFYVS